jgi:hypothetical protein
MKRLVVVLALAVLLGSGVYFIAYTVVQRTLCPVSNVEEPLGWMRQEFHLNDAQLAQVKKLEDDYAPRCKYMCDQIEQSHKSLTSLIMTHGNMSPEVKAALQKDADVQQQCRMDMLNHVYDISKVMPPAEGKRYLQMMQAQVVHPEQTASTTVDQH